MFPIKLISDSSGSCLNDQLTSVVNCTIDIHSKLYFVSMDVVVFKASYVTTLVEHCETSFNNDVRVQPFCRSDPLQKLETRFPVEDFMISAFICM